jgi:phosphoribosylglycinamide formyltransferase
MHDPPDTKATILISGEGTNLQALIDASSSTMPYLKIKVRDKFENKGFE